MLFLSILNQMAVLFLFMVIGFLLVKFKVVGENGSQVLSKLENFVFVPCLCLSTFMNQFTVQTITSAYKLLLFSLIIELVVLPISILIAKLCSKDDFIRKMYTYGLCFSNFGFMGNAVVLALFPEDFLYYLIFTLPLWVLIYAWGVPSLLMDKPSLDGPSKTSKNKLVGTLKNFFNPMFIAMIIGIILGLTGVKLPSFMVTVVDTCGSCMSPIAMIITGMVFANMDFKKILGTISIYVVSIIRTLVFPLVFGGLVLVINNFIFPIPTIYYTCLICAMAMPLGLNTIIIPSAYGKDTSVPAGMALVSHLMSLLTIPLILTILL